MKILIMAVPWDPKRAVSAKRLAEATGGEVVWDEKQSISDTFLRMLERAGEGPAVFLQDDVILTSNWREKLEAALVLHESEPVQFFSIRKADLTRGSRYEPGRSWLMHQCWYLPKGDPPALLDYARTWFEQRPGHTGDDSCVSDWLRSSGRHYWHHVPSLVQHKEWDSTLGSRSSRRLSPTFQED